MYTHVKNFPKMHNSINSEILLMYGPGRFDNFAPYFDVLYFPIYSPCKGSTLNMRGNFKPYLINQTLNKP